MLNKSSLSNLEITQLIIHNPSRIGRNDLVFNTKRIMWIELLECKDLRDLYTFMERHQTPTRSMRLYIEASDF